MNRYCNYPITTNDLITTNEKDYSNRQCSAEEGLYNIVHAHLFPKYRTRYLPFLEVWAIKITAIWLDVDFSAHLGFVVGSPYGPIHENRRWFEQYHPQVGSYYVVRDVDGYLFSTAMSAKGFDKRYERV